MNIRRFLGFQERTAFGCDVSASTQVHIHTLKKMAYLQFAVEYIIHIG